MDCFETRREFLKFFESRDHTVVASSSLVPAYDPSLLFVNAGMVQFKDVFTGLETRPYSRACSAQKCLRVSGKHNDLNDVGASVRHTTFFEMLGNFSFGDYFKLEAMEFAWEFLTSTMGLSGDRLWPTVYEEDDEAFQIWRDQLKIPEQRITRLGKKDNFWSMGESGPCGPCSELIYDRGAHHCTCHRPDCHLANDDCERWWEVWNLVFMEYFLERDGSHSRLQQQCVDTGAGLERLVVVANDLDSVYDTDQLSPLLNRIRELASDDAREAGLDSYASRAIADHCRSIAFMIADNIMPSNEGRGYILRLLMRRAVRFGRKLGIDKPFLGAIAEPLIERMGAHYRELRDHSNLIMEVIASEEEQFERTLTSGLQRLERIIDQTKNSREKIVPADEVFKLYDTFGFPHMLTQDIAREHGLEIDEPGFQAAMEEQRMRSRSATQFSSDESEQVYRKFSAPPTEFHGYDGLTSRSRILGLLRNGEFVDEACEGDEVEVILDVSVCYPESGGQVGDQGVLDGSQARVVVENTFRPVPSYIAHKGKVVQGRIRRSAVVRLTVDEARRHDASCHHTATHLLHKALQQTVGAQVRQAGSLVTPDGLRFDFTHLRPLTREQLDAIEQKVNEMIRRNLEVVITHLAHKEAIEQGAMALFGEKYGDVVRVVSVVEQEPSHPRPSEPYSIELCGGTHVRRTGDIGQFRILSETGVGRALRRIEAVAGARAERYTRERLALLDNAVARFQCQDKELLERIEGVFKENANLRKESQRHQRSQMRSELATRAEQAEVVAGVRIIVADVGQADTDALRELCDWLRDKFQKSVVVLGCIEDKKPVILVAVASQLVEEGIKANDLAKGLAELMGGGGGGRPTFARAGGKSLPGFKQAMNEAASLVRRHLQAAE